MSTRVLIVATIIAVLAAAGNLYVLWAQPDLRGDGFLTGWQILVKRQSVCFNPYVNTKDRTISCG